MPKIKKFLSHFLPPSARAFHDKMHETHITSDKLQNLLHGIYNCINEIPLSTKKLSDEIINEMNNLSISDKITDKMNNLSTSTNILHDKFTSFNENLNETNTQIKKLEHAVQNINNKLMPPQIKKIPNGFLPASCEEVHNLSTFAQSFNNIFIYGVNEKEQYLFKFLDIIGIKIKGFIVTDENDILFHNNPKNKITNAIFFWKKKPIILLNDITFSADCGVIIAGKEDTHLNIIKALNVKCCTHYMSASEQLMVSIFNRMKPRRRKDFSIEYHITHHCNLGCAMCAHYSQLAKPWFAKIVDFEREMERLSELTNGYIWEIRLLGGEPLLHKDINSFIKIARKYFKNTNIEIWTNGKLATNKKYDHVWDCIKENNAVMRPTGYPNISDYEKIKTLADKKEVLLRYSEAYLDEKKPNWDKMTLDLDGNAESYRFVSCRHFNMCQQLRDGKIYICPTCAYADLFNIYFNQNLLISKKDYIDIFEVNNFYQILEFLSKPSPFCRYCPVEKRTKHEWKQTSRTIEEYL